MQVAIPCPGCRRTVHAPETLVGKRVKCPKCFAIFVVPTPGVNQRPGQRLVNRLRPVSRQHYRHRCRATRAVLIAGSPTPPGAGTAQSTMPSVSGHGAPDPGIPKEYGGIGRAACFFGCLGANVVSIVGLANLRKGP